MLKNNAVTIVFIGCVESSFAYLETLIQENVHIIGAISKPSSNFNSDFKSLEPLCNTHDIPLHLTMNINNEHTINWVKELNPDVIFCFGWSQLIKKELLHIPNFGIVGYHPADLPNNKGRHPLIWALVLGLKETGSTFFMMDELADNGGIISQSPININYEDNAQTVYQKMIKTGQSQIKAIIQSINNKTFPKIIKKNSQGNHWRKRNKDDGQIDFRMTSNAIYNLVRALYHPYPGSHVLYNNQEIKIWKVKEVNEYQPNIECGKILDVSKKEILVSCYQSAILIVDHEFKTLPKIGEYL